MRNLRLCGHLLQILVGGCATSPLFASVTITFEEFPSGVRASYGGSINSSVLVFEGSVQDEGRYLLIDDTSQDSLYAIFQNFLGDPPRSFRYSFDLIEASWSFGVPDSYFQAIATSGDLFGFVVSANGASVGSHRGVAYLPWDYSSGSSIEGEVSFSGLSLADMGLNTDSRIDLRFVDGQRITAIVVPEPSVGICIGLGFVVIAANRRRGTAKKCRTSRRWRRRISRFVEFEAPRRRAIP